MIRTKDPEILAMRAIERALRPLDPNQQRRALAWAHERFVVPATSSTRTRDVHTVRVALDRNNVHPPVTATPICIPVPASPRKADPVCGANTCTGVAGETGAPPVADPADRAGGNNVHPGITVGSDSSRV